jgi:hypothetical protein
MLVVYFPVGADMLLRALMTSRTSTGEPDPITLNGESGYTIVVTRVGICGVGGNNVGDNNPSGPSIWFLRWTREGGGTSERTFGVSGNGGHNGDFDLGATPEFNRNSPRCTSAQCGKGYVVKDAPDSFRFPEGENVHFGSSQLSDNDGEYCYGKTPAGVMTDDSAIGTGTSRGWVEYHYEKV